MDAAAVAPSFELTAALRRWRGRAAATGVVALVLLIAGALFNPGQFFSSYLWSYMFYVGLSVGCLALLMLQYLTGGAWGVMIRRLCEAGARTLPLIAILFIPVLIGIPRLYLWSHSDAVAVDNVLKHKQIYLNVPFFLARAALYFGGWLLCARLLNRWSAAQDGGDESAQRRMERFSGPGLVFYSFSVTFMAIDWILSVAPHWFSTIFGMLFIIGQGLSAIAFVITATVLLSRFGPFSEFLTRRHIHDLGKLMLTFVMVWAYFSFSQFLIIWSGNLPDEIPWYLQRLRGGWGWIGLALVILHFALPFALLLSRDLKRSYPLLAGVAVFVLVMRFVDLYWIVVPDLRKGGFGVSWMDFVAPVALGGVWLSFYLWQLPRRPLLPLHDPSLEKALQHGRE